MSILSRLATLFTGFSDGGLVPQRKPLLVYAATRRQAEQAEASFNYLRPDCAKAIIAPCDFHEWLDAWHDGEIDVLIVNYRNCTGFRCPKDASVMLLDGCPDEAHRAQCHSRVERASHVPRSPCPLALCPDNDCNTNPCHTCPTVTTRKI